MLSARGSLQLVIAGFAMITASAHSQAAHPQAKSGPTLLITTNQACTLQADGVNKGQLAQGGIITIHVQLGEHLINCTAVDGPDVDGVSNERGTVGGQYGAARRCRPDRLRRPSR